MFWSLKLGTRPQGGESGGPILEFVIYLRFGAWDLLFEKLVLGVWDFINPSIPKQLAIFTGKAI